ncbi:xanthine dehydrogenase family protein molybdopterin-binding subunit [Chloroflexota bacterium]
MSEAFNRRATHKYVGTYRPRMDGWEKASGSAKYADDIATECHFPNMLYAKILRSPYPHARIKYLDTIKAEKLSGVQAILTYKDPEIASLKPTNAGWTDGVDTVTYDRMMWKRFRDRRVLSDHVCWVGDEAGVVVAAESEQIAEEALRLVDVQWEVLPFVLDPIEAMKPGAPIIHPEIRSDSNVFPPDDIGGPDVFFSEGDTEKGFAEADIIADVTATYHNANQGVLDKWCCLAEWNNDKLTVWSNSYEADQTRMYISEMLELPLNKVRIISSYVGGQFGKGDTGEQPFFLLTALLARKTGRPVKFQLTRRESFLNTRQPVIYDCKMGAKKDGKITSSYFKAIGNAGAYADHTLFAIKFAPVEIAEAALSHIPNLKLEAYCVYTNKLSGAMMRGVGSAQMNFALGLAIDVLAEKLNMDPIDLALKNFGYVGETLPDKSLKAVLEEGAKRILWDKRHKPGEGPTYGGLLKRGIGFSCHPSWHAEWQELRRGHIQVGIKVNPDCTVTLEAPTVECGPGSNTCNVLSCAEALSFLGVKPEDISWVSTVDTDTCFKDTVQTDSSVSYLQAEVIKVAAAEIKTKILEVAALHFKTKPEQLQIEDGYIYFKAKPEKKMSVKALLLEKGNLVPIVATVSRIPAGEMTGIPFFATFAETEVNTATGRVEVLKLIVLNDCGTVMYASGAEAQQVGGQCIGVGESLTEEIIYDEKTGIPLNFNWIDYKIPTMVDMPDVEPVLLEVWKGAGEYGACGIGEAVVCCTPRAIANAIYNAIGVRIDEVPIKPEKVLKALGKI